MLISLEGNISSGKTTLFNKLKEKYEHSDIIFVPEPVEQWQSLLDEDGNSMLEKFYDNKKKYSFMFQIMVAQTMIEKIKKARQYNKNSVIITERSVYSSRKIFCQMLYEMEDSMEYVEYKIYRDMYDTVFKAYEPDYIIYLKTDAEICLERLHKRNRYGECNISLEYLQNIEHYHEAMINSLSDTNIICNLELNGNQEMCNQYFKNCIDEIGKLIHNLYKEIYFKKED